MATKKKLYLEQRVVPIDKMESGQSMRVQRREEEWPVEYVVQKVIGSIDPKVHATLSSEQVDHYCEQEDWEVTIV